jgi:hypothetical protein
VVAKKAFDKALHRQNQQHPRRNKQRNQANAKDQKSFPTYNVREYGGNIKAQHKKSFFVSGYKPYQKQTQSQA